LDPTVSIQTSGFAWMRLIARVFLALLGIALVAGGVGGWYVWEQLNREKLQPTLDGRGGSEAFKLGRGGGESELQLDFVRKAGDGGFALAFPFGARTCTLMLDVPDGDGKLYSGLDLIEGQRFHDSKNPTRISGPVLSTGTLHRLKVLSLRDEVQVLLDDKLLIDFNGPSNVVGSSPVLPEIHPAEKLIVAIDCKLRVYRTYGRMASIWSPFPKEFELGEVEQVLGEGAAEELTGYALRLTGEPVRLAPASKLIDFQNAFTVEFWYRRTEDQAKWIGLTSGSIEVELHNSEQPEIHISYRTGGNFGPSISTLDTNWHHIAVCNDGYYVMLYLDGQFVCKGNSSYFYQPSSEFRIGANYSFGHRNSGFYGDIREIRISSIARYPMGCAFNAPMVLGNDEHTVARVRFEENQANIESSIGPVRVLGTQIKTVSIANE
jgi:hypothetical protein